MPEEQNQPVGDQQQPVPDMVAASQPAAVPEAAPPAVDPAVVSVQPPTPVVEQAAQPAAEPVAVPQPVATDPNAAPVATVVTPPTPVAEPVAAQPAPAQSYPEIIPGVTIVSAPVAVDTPAVPVEPTIPPPVVADPNAAPVATVVTPPTPVAEPAMPAEPVAEQPAGKKKVLIVEDERPLAHALELKLGHDGYETTVAPTGTKGLEEASSGKYDLMLLDLILPELDGFELLRQLRERESKIPVVILSNLGQEEDKKRVEDYNVAQYCVKSNMPLSAIVNTVKVLTT